MDKVSSQLSSSSPSADKLKAGDLKSYLKNAGVSATGDKPTLWWRCKTHHTVVTLGLLTSDGAVPTTLKPAQLRKAAAKVGVSPIGTPDEMLEGLVNHLTKNNRAAAATTGSTDPASGEEPAETQARGPALAEAVLSLADASVVSPVRILQLSDPSLQPTSSASELRKAYLKISLHIHPDRIGSEFKDATKAFQILVTAYETLTSPDYIPSADGERETKRKGKKKNKSAGRISRSNEGCFRTDVRCPRCNARWGDKIEGNPDWVYNVMMQGLKSFHCSTCLLKFGCMSAQHRCPHCRKPFSYSPEDYHRKITCTSPKCNKPFGFYLYHMSDRALKDLRAEILQAHDDFSKKMAGMKRRANRSRRGQEEDEVSELRAFEAGLADECPKCGIDFAELLREGISPEVHLMNCNDEVAHAKQRSKKDARRKKEAGRAKARDAQNDAESRAAWEFLGRNNDQLYLLSEGQLQKELKEKGVESKAGDDKADMIAALVNRERSLVVRDGGNVANRSARSLPSLSTLQRMDVDELRAVLASHGMGGGKLKSMDKRMMLDMLEDKVYKNDDDDVKNVKLLTNAHGVSCDDHPVKKRKKEEVVVEVDDSDSDDDWKPVISLKRKKEKVVVDIDDSDSDDDKPMISLKTG